MKIRANARKNQENLGRFIRKYINPLSGNAPKCTLIYYFTLSNARLFYLSGGECCHSILNSGYFITIPHKNLDKLSTAPPPPPPESMSPVHLWKFLLLANGGLQRVLQLWHRNYQLTNIHKTSSLNIKFNTTNLKQ
jgi:hypothetical protein